MEKDSRFVSIKILIEFEKSNRKLYSIRNDFFLIYSLEPNAKARVMVLTNDIVRLKGRLDLLICEISKRKIEKINIYNLNILRLGFYEILYDKNIPNYASVNSAVNMAQIFLNKRAAGFTNAILRNLTREKKNDINFLNKFKSKLEWNSFPIWIQKKWEVEYGKENYLKLVNFFNQKQNIYARISNVILKNKIFKELKNNGFNYEVFNNNFIKLISSSRSLLDLNLFKNGSISIQDPAAGAVVDLLDPKSGDIVLDICAAPGTKSLYISEKIGEKGKVLAYDNNSKRIKKAKNDNIRNYRKNIFWKQKDATYDAYPKADKILIDAPCSGTGVIGNKPDIRWRRKPNDILNMSKLQLKILENVSKYLNLGGSLVYSTCSLEKEENWDVVEQFLKLNVNFKLDKLNTMIPSEWVDKKGCLNTIPYIHNVSGMFAVKIKRT